MFENNTTIAAIATAQAAGGIGVIRVSGEEAFTICDKVFRSVSGEKLSETMGYRAHFGRVFDSENDIDECVALVFRSPHSYTGENVVELSCHGGLYVLKKVLRAVFSAGACPAQAGEFTQRAFINGKIDLTQAQAVMDLISAHGKQSANAALTALDGALSREIKKSCDILVSSSANLAAWVDYPDEEIDELSEGVLADNLNSAKEILEKLIKSFDAGSAVTQGVDAVIAGKPNVGKSTLMNLLSGSEKSIVSEYAGTTRDAVEETVSVGGVVLRLTDTAGIRDSDNPVESIGVEIAKKKLERSAIVIAVFDSSRELDSYDMQMIEKCRDKKCIAVINKCDLENKCDISEIEKHIPNTVRISAETGAGKDDLEKAVSKLLGTDDIDTSCAMLTSERQLLCTEEALKYIDEALEALECGITLDAVNVCIDCAIGKLLELTGERAADSVVNEIFSQFCVGK